MLQRSFFILCALLLSACGSDTGTGPSTAESTSTNTPAAITGFQFQVNGSAEHRGPGDYRAIPSGSQRAGYHYLTDGLDDQYNLVLILPLDARIGTHTLNTPAPQDTGAVYEMRLNTQDNSGPYSYNTRGTLNIDRIQHQDGVLTSAAGRFQFHSANIEGAAIEVSGQFNYQPQ